MSRCRVKQRVNSRPIIALLSGTRALTRLNNKLRHHPNSNNEKKKASPCSFKLERSLQTSTFNRPSSHSWRVSLTEYPLEVYSVFPLGIASCRKLFMPNERVTSIHAGIEKCSAAIKQLPRQNATPLRVFFSFASIVITASLKLIQ